MTQDRKERLAPLTKLLYGAGDLGFSLTDTTLGVLYGIFLTDVIGLAPRLAALAVFIGRSWDWLNDPLIGHLTDRTRSRWGRRRPFLLFGWLPFALAFALMWWRPPIDNQLWLAVFYGFAYFLFDTTATFVYMPYFALTPELTLDYDERTSLTSYRMAFSIVGGLIAFTVPLAVIGTMRPENLGTVGWVGLAIGLASGFPLLLTFFGTRERPEFQAEGQPSIRASLKAALRNRPFLFAVGIFLFTWTGIEFIQGMLLYFLKYRMGLETQSDLVAGTVFVSALITLPFWVWISGKWDKRVAYVAGMLFLSGVMITLIVIDPSWGLALVFTLAGLAGIGVGAVHVLPWAMIPDAIEVAELETGQRHEGMFYSLVTLLRKVASSIAVPAMLLALDASGYVANAPQQAPSAITAIRMLMGPVPSFFLVLGIIFALVYPLGRNRHAEIRAELEKRRHTETAAR